MSAATSTGLLAIRYHVERDFHSGKFQIQRDGQPVISSQDDSDFLFLIEKDMTVELQRRRPDLFFVHAAVVEYGGRTALIAAPSGTGKSTFAFALLHADFRYLSDELAPVDPLTLKVHPYPHALCLKAQPPAPYQLPDGTLVAERTLHVPPAFLPGDTLMAPQPLSAIFFIHRNTASRDVDLRKLGHAEVAARLYANTLNALAHPDRGLEIAVRLAQSIPGYELNSSDLKRAVLTFQASLT